MSPRPRFASLDPEKSRAILAAAASEIAAEGIDGASYNRIIARAGISKGAMYYYFDDKSDLCQTVVRDAAERAAAAVGEISPFDDAHSFWDALADLYQRIVVFLVSEPELSGLLKAVIAEHHGGRPSEIYIEYLGRIEESFSATLEQAVVVGAVRNDLPVQLLARVAFAIGEAIDRWTLENWETLAPVEFDRISDDMLEIHMRALAPLPLLLELQSRAPQRKESSR